MPRFEDLENAGLRVVIGGDGIVQSIIDSQGRNTGVQTGKIAFPDFVPRILAALVVSSTAACTSGVVTVSATSHSIPATYADGFEIYYPGSPTLAAGWYGGFTRTSADAFTFLAPSSADFGSESINAGAIFTSEVTFYSLTIPGKLLKVGDIVSVRYTATYNGTGTKSQTLKYGSTIIARNTATTTRMTADFGFAVSGVAKQSGNIGSFGTANTAYNGTVDMTVDQALDFTGASLSSSGVLIIHAAKVEIM